MRRLPAGRWAVCHRRISDDEVTEAVQAFLDGMKDGELAGEGDLYMTDDFNYLFPGDDPERFDVVLSRKIREQEAPRAQSSPNPF